MNVPEQWFECRACDGYGVEVFGTTVYEPGCGFSHASSDERPCPHCHGDGGRIGEAKTVRDLEDIECEFQS